MFAKKILVVLLVIGLAALVGGCGGKEAMEEPATDVEAPPEVKAPPEVESPVVKEEPQEISMSAINDVFFAFDKYSLTDESKRTLEAGAQELKRATVGNIIIEGHCDERGTKAYNLALGEKRARAAMDYLTALGVDGARITVVSYGKERPFDPGHDEAAWAKNRRAHFVLQK